MPYYRKKPVVIEAMEIPATDMTEFAHWMMENCKTTFECADGEGCTTTTLEAGVMHILRGHPGDMMVLDEHGEMVPWRRAMFDATYEEVAGYMSRGS